jgi:death-on-curing protein
MTEEKKSKTVIYLTTEFIKQIHATLAKRFESIGEPIPPLNKSHEHEIENLVLLPQQTFSGIELYPTLESKAAILFYKVNKSQIFPNGNKRLSLALLLIFLRINGYGLFITEDEATQKALWLANSPAEDFEKVKKEVEDWITINLKEL